MLLQAGAYTVGYREYNGFPFPGVQVTRGAAPASISDARLAVAV